MPCTQWVPGGVAKTGAMVDRRWGGGVVFGMHYPLASQLSPFLTLSFPSSPAGIGSSSNPSSRCYLSRPDTQLQYLQA